MQVQSISNQNFTGSVLLSRKLNPKIAGYVLNTAHDIGIANKSYNLEIKNIKDGSLKFLSIKAYNPVSPEQRYRVLVQDFLQKKDVLQSAVYDATTGYESITKTQNLDKVI